MIRFIALVLMVALFNPAGSTRAAPAQAVSEPTGLWLTQDRDGIIAVSSCGNAICARIVGVVLDRASDPMPVDHRGVSQCGLALITDAKQVRHGVWKGHILDPRNGSMFGVELWLKDADHLALRGFLGITLLGRTEDWTRYAGSVPANCRMVAGGQGG